MRNYVVQLLNAVNTASATGAACFVGQAVSASFCPINGDVTATGTVKIQGSNDIPVSDPKTFIPTNWCDITNATSAISSGVGPAIVLQTMNFQYVRAVYTRASGGSTTITVNMTALAV